MYHDKEIDWEENGRIVRVKLLCCTCCDCYAFNRIERKDPIFGEELPIKFRCAHHDKDVTPDQEPCKDFR